MHVAQLFQAFLLSKNNEIVEAALPNVSHGDGCTPKRDMLRQDHVTDDCKLVALADMLHNFEEEIALPLSCFRRGSRTGALRPAPDRRRFDSVSSDSGRGRHSGRRNCTSIADLH